MKKKVLLKAPVLSLSGYGVHSRQIFKWLESQGEKVDYFVQAVPWGATSWLVNPDSLDGLVGRVMAKTGNYPSAFDVSIQVVLPNEWDVSLAKFNVGVTAGVETDLCNPSWIGNINRMDLVIVPSEHVKTTFENTGIVRTKIAVVPEAFIESVEKKELPDLGLEFETDFNFLLVGQITGHDAETDRKNTFSALKWLCESFRKDKDVGIVIKTNSARNSTFDRNGTKDVLKHVLSSVRKDGVPPVYFIHGELSDDEMAALYRHSQVKAYVSATRGEGFGLPFLEAAASDLPVIATNWSAHTEFLGKGKFLPVEYDLRAVSERKIDKRACGACKGSGKVGPMTICQVCGGTGHTQIFMEGAKWAEARENSFKKVVKNFRQMPDKPTEWAQDLGKTLRDEYSQQAIQTYYDKVFSSLELW